MRFVLTSILVLLAASTAGAEAPKITPQQAEFFETHIRPVLVERCFECHGPQKQRAGLRVDSRELLLQGSENGTVVVPGDPTKSLLIRVIQHSTTPKMPPRDKLPPAAIDALSTWVKMGLPWPGKTAFNVAVKNDDAGKRHWAFQPVKLPPSPVEGVGPAVRGDASLSPVDLFIVDALSRKGLKLSPPADRRTLIRRATFDLIGLPPTPDEVAAFLADNTPQAFARVVDRLLASPHYGERWGRHWLDVARYSDTKGYVFFEENEYPWAHTYRDYVIRAFNDDVPFDQFILHQLAADQLVEPGKSESWPLAAMGFLTVGGRFMNNKHDIIDDRIDVVTRGLMGLTVTCARCHDHKYDPVPTGDYYSLYGVFASCYEPPVPPLFAPPPTTEAYLKFDNELKAREKNLTDFVQAKHSELVNGAKKRVAEYLLAAEMLRDQPDTQDFMLLSNTEDLNPTMIRRWKGFLDRTEKQHHPVFAPWHAFAALKEMEFVEKAAGVCASLEQGRINPLVAKAFVTVPKSLKEVAERYSQLLNDVEKRAPSPLPLSPGGRGEGVREEADAELHAVFHAADAPPNIKVPPLGDLALLPDRPSQAKLKELLKSLEEWRGKGAGAVPRAMVLHDLPTPVQPRVFRRGNPGNPGDVVARQFPAVLAGEKRQPFKNGSGRLELARAIVDPRNPLTARVIANRIWLHHFGAGLVRTPSDFGLRSDPPSHPELLDYLAGTFVSTGWSVKRLHRLIMLSQVYQQQSADRPEGLASDPENRLFWKMNRQRLDFETLRDSFLATADQLDHSIGGAAVKNIMAADAKRRTLYGFIDRLNLATLYRTFDFPSPDATSPERSVTTVPQQALFLMNNPFAIACARNVLNRRDLVGAMTTEAKVERLYQVMYGRNPTAAELQLGSQFNAQGDAASWQRYVQALLLSNEFCFVD